MTKIGVLSNLRSARNKSSMRGVHDVLAAHPDIPHLAFTKMDQLRCGLRDLAAAGVTHLVISGGDGTVQAGINHLLQDLPFATLPSISLIAGGMTNVIARDVGAPGKPAPALRRIIERIKSGNAGENLQRRVIGLSRDSGSSRTYGFVGGAIGFYQGTVLSRKHAHRVGLSQTVAANATVIQSLFRLLYYGPGPKSGFDGEKMMMSIDGGPAEPRDLSIMLFTTLTQLTPAVKPFWGNQDRGVKYMLLDHPPQCFLRAIVPTLRGRAKPWMEAAGYHSATCDHLEMTLQSPFVMDGEIFPPQGGRTIITAGPAIPFVRY